jgi:hypothetical protein
VCLNRNDTKTKHFYHNALILFIFFLMMTAEKHKSKNSDSKKEPHKDGAPHIAAQTFTFRELAAATKNFRPESLLGEGGFGRVYKGRLENTGQASYSS